MAKGKKELVKMNKHEMKKELKERLQIPTMEVAEKVLNTVIDIFKEGILTDMELNDGRASFQIPGLGTFKTKLTRGRTMDNPKIGTITIPTQFTGRFSLTKSLKDEIKATGQKFIKEKKKK